MDQRLNADLRHILEGTASHTGGAFFRALVENLSLVLEVDGAWVTRLDAGAQRLVAEAFFHRGGWIEGYAYDIARTPCEPVVAQARFCHFPDRILELFPDDPDLAPLDAVAYLGAPLTGDEGEVLGHLAAIHGAPLPLTPRLRAIVDIFAARAAAELRRVVMEEELRERERRLSWLIEGALDAIVELDDAMKIRLMNPGAEKLFGCAAGQVRNSDLRRLLTTQSGERLRQLATEVSGRARGQQQAWVPGGLTGRRRDGSTFQAEATVSRTWGGAYTLILRDVNARVEAERRIGALTEEREYLRAEIRELRNVGAIVGESPAVRRVLDEVQQVAPTDSTVLLLGESGTGKELFAGAIHAASPRADRTLIKLNCAALPAQLVESELFGHEKGAFTGAVSARKGRFALADGGTILLDEIGELPLELQAKLLRVLQEGEYEPVGSSTPVRVDVRVIAATHRDVRQMVERGEFREDLYYRLYVFPIRIPPLRERGDDILLLAEKFIDTCARRMGRPVPTLTQSQRAQLKAYGWPGNVRELQNVLERAVITADGATLDLSRALGTPPAVAPAAAAVGAADHDRILTVDELAQLERANICRAMARSRGRVSGVGGAAEILRMKPTTLYSRLKALGVRPDEYGGS